MHRGPATRCWRRQASPPTARPNTRTARATYLEPVGTYPAYPRMGLARAVIGEGLRRANHLGATRAFVTRLAPGANRLYDTAVGPTYVVSERWVKRR